MYDTVGQSIETGTVPDNLGHTLARPITFLISLKIKQF